MRYLWFFLLIFLSSNLAAQKKDYIKGRVMDSLKNPLPFASIGVIQNNKMICGTAADTSGYYILEIPDSLKNFTISVLMVGMKRKDINIKRIPKKQ